VEVPGPVLYNFVVLVLIFIGFAESWYDIKLSIFLIKLFFILYFLGLGCNVRGGGPLSVPHTVHMRFDDRAIGGAFFSM
jgi:hypothetical protein